MREPCPDEVALSGFVTRSVSADQASQLETHIADCGECRRLVFALASDDGAAEAGPAVERIGRFALEGVIGRGAMGVVYRARDPELDRAVAIKLRARRTTLDTDGEDRLRREAQALARLAHPNVVAVYEAGRHEHATYFAMELVEGATLDVWLAKAPSREAVLARMVEVGRGLDAAHAVGLVHRDVKPHNILIAHSGVAKIGDFGLVRVGAAEPPVAASPDTRAIALTLSGAMLGTPAYMAPEQLHGEPASEASDQFSYCVTLFEAIYGKRPFAGATVKELLAAMRTPVTIPRGPRDVMRTLTRGLAHDPAQRFPSMSALLDVLVPRRSRRGLVAAAIAMPILAAGGIAFASMNQAEAPPPPCQSAEHDLHGIWDLPRKVEIQRAFLVTHTPYGADTWRGVARIFDQYTSEWTAMRRDACEATRVHREQSEAVLALRMTCLDDRMREAKAVSDAFADSDAAMLTVAVDVASKLPSIAMCADTRALAAKQPPRDAAAAERLDVIRTEIAQAYAATNLGRLDKAVATLERAQHDLEREDYAPLAAEAAFWLARARFLSTGDAKAAEQMLRDTLLEAERGRDDELRARIYTVLVYFVGVVQQRPDEARTLVKYAEAVLQRLVGMDDLKAALLAYEGQLADLEGRFNEAKQLLEQSLKLLERDLGPDHPEVGRAHAQLASVARELDDAAGALEHAQRAHAIHERAYGPNHPETARSLFAVAAALEDFHRYDEAAADIDRVIATLEAALGKDHIDLAVAVSELGTIRMKQGRLDDAIALHRRGLALREKVLGPNHPDVTISLDNLASTLNLAGRPREALALERRSLAITTAVYGAEHPATAYAISSMGTAYMKLHEPREALAMYRKALAIYEKNLGPEHGDLRYALLGIAESLMDLHQPRAALAPAERFLRLAEKVGDPKDISDGKLFVEEIRRNRE